MSGSKLLMSVAVNLAKLLDVSSMVFLGILMYRRKQSLDQRPSAWISHLGQPAAAAVEAAPMRRECDEMLTLPLVDSTSTLLMSLLDKNRPLANVNNGPDLVGCVFARCRRAFTGHNLERFLAILNMTPSRKGSVLDFLMSRLTDPSFLKDMSENSNVDAGSKEVLRCDVYSDTLKNP